MGSEAEMSRNEFIAAMINHLEVSMASPSISLNPASCFREFCFDFPAVGEEEVKTLNQEISTFLSKLNKATSEKNGKNYSIKAVPDWFILSPAFVKGIQECFLKFDDNKNEEDMPFKKELSLLYCNVYLKLIERALKDPLVCDQVLGCRDNEVSDECEVLALMCQGVSYHYLSHISPSTWESEHVTATVYRIVRLLSIEQSFGQVNKESAVRLKSCWPQYLFLLRDRMVHFPETIPDLLPAVIEIIEKVDDSSPILFGDSLTKEPNSILLGTLAVLVESPSVRQASKNVLEFLWTFIWKLLAAFVKKLDSISGILKSGSEDGSLSKVELKSLLFVFEFMSGGDPKKPFTDKAACEKLFGAGVIRTLLQLWLSKNIYDDRDYVGYFLLGCCTRSQNIVLYVTKIDGFQKKIEKLSTVDNVLWETILSARIANHEQNQVIQKLDNFLDFDLNESDKEVTLKKFRYWIEFLDFVSKRHVVRLLLDWKTNSELVDLLKRLRKKLGKFCSMSADSVEEDPLARKDRHQRVCKLIKRVIGRLSLNGAAKCD